MLCLPAGNMLLAWGLPAMSPPTDMAILDFPRPPECSTETAPSSLLPGRAQASFRSHPCEGSPRHSHACSQTGQPALDWLFAKGVFEAWECVLGRSHRPVGSPTKCGMESGVVRKGNGALSLFSDSSP